jgi:hypothetical protein
MSTDNSHLFHRTINDENYVKKLEDLYYYALTKFGTGAEVILHQWPIEEGKSAADSDSAPWNGVSQDQIQKIKFAGANLYGLLITSLSDLMKDALDNAGVTRTIGGTDYYATIMAMVAEIRRRNGGVSAAYAAADNLKRLITCSIRSGEAVETYVARFNAIVKTVDTAFTTPVGLAQFMVIGMQSNTALYQDIRMPTVQPIGGYRTIAEVMIGLNTLTGWKKDYAEVTAMTATATTTTTVPKHTKTQGPAGGGEKVCLLCTGAKGEQVKGHLTVDAEGNIQCYRLMRMMKLEVPKKAAMTSTISKLKQSDEYSNSSRTYYSYNEVQHTCEIALRAAQQGATKDTLIFDPGASATILNNKDWFADMEPIKMEIQGIAGTVSITHVGRTIFGIALYGPLKVQLISTNAIHRMHKHDFQVEYNWEENEFTLTGKELEPLTFRTSKDLRVPHAFLAPRKPEKTTSVTQVSLSAIQQRTDDSRVLKRAEAAVTLHRALNHIPYSTMLRTLRAGQLRTSVTARDLTVAERQWGACPICVGARSHHENRGGNYHPAENPGEHLHCDEVFLKLYDGKKHPFHISKDERCSRVDIDRMQGTSARDLHEVQIECISRYRALGHEVIKFYYDDGSAAKATKGALGNLGIKLHTWGAGQHESEAENYAGTLRLDMKASTMELPYILPRQCIEYCAKDACAVRSLVVNSKTGMETPFSLTENDRPSEHMLTIPFGSIVYASIEPVQGQPLSGSRAQGIVVRRYPTQEGKCTVFFLHNQSFGERQVHTDDIIRNPGQALIQAINALTDGQYDIGDCVTTSKEITNPHDQAHQRLIEHNRYIGSIGANNKSAARSRNKASIKPNVESTSAEQLPSSNSTDIIISPPPMLVPLPTAKTGAKTKMDKATAQTSALEDVHLPTAQSKDKRTKATAQNLAPDDNYRREYTNIRRPLTMETTITMEEGDSDEDSTSENETIEPTLRRSIRNSTANTAYVDNNNTKRWRLRKSRNKRHNTKPDQLMLSAIEKRKNGEDLIQQRAYVMLLNQLVNQGETGVEAAKREIRNILDHKSLRPEHKRNLTEKQCKECITSFMFGKRKLSGQLKGRAVMNGKQQVKREQYQNLHSPTASPLTSMIHLTVASHQKRKHVFSADFPSAYLKVDRAKHNMPKEFTRITGQLAKLFIAEEPSLEEYTINGVIYFEIIKSIYGLTESAALWFKDLRDMLIELGYVQMTDADPCLFVHPTTKSSINIHVDDCLCTCATDKEKDRLMEFFNKHECTVHVGDFTFLSMDIKQRKDKTIEVSMEKFLTKLMQEWNISGTEEGPTSTQFGKTDNSPPTERRAEYVARVMALMYAAIRVRFDILFAVAILSQKCQQPTKQNFDELDYLLRYINGSLDKAVILDTTSLDIHVWADASFMLHDDRKGQTGVAVTLGVDGPCVGPKSSKAKMLTTSSTEQEILAAFEATPLLRKTTQIMKAFGSTSVPVLHQDNQSAIDMAESGGGSSKHTKHFDLRLKYLQEMIKGEEFTMLYTPTEEMKADVFTKNTTGIKFRTFMDALMCNKQRPKEVKQDAMLAYFTKLGMPTSKGRAGLKPTNGKTNTHTLRLTHRQ